MAKLKFEIPGKFNNLALDSLIGVSIFNYQIYTFPQYLESFMGNAVGEKELEELQEDSLEMNWVEAKHEYERKFMTDAMYWH